MALSVEHFGRTYATATGTFTAVEDLSFSVRSGEIVGLIGPNGAGKTTTLRSLAGILRPTSGRVSVDGHDLIDDPIEAKRRLAFMPDEPHLFEYLTVEEHLRLVARLYGVADFETPRRHAHRGARADREGALAAGRAVARDAAEGRHRLRPDPERDDAAVRRAADRARPDRHPPHAQHDRGAGPRRRGDPAVVAPPAPGGGGLHARDHHGPRAEGRRRHLRGARVARRSGDRRLEPRADLPARHRPRTATRVADDA